MQWAGEEWFDEEGGAKTVPAHRIRNSVITACKPTSWINLNHELAHKGFLILTITVFLFRGIEGGMGKRGNKRGIRGGRTGRRGM